MSVVGLRLVDLLPVAGCQTTRIQTSIKGATTTDVVLFLFLYFKKVGQLYK